MGQKHLEIAQLFKDFVQKNPGRIADLQFFGGGKWTAIIFCCQLFNVKVKWGRPELGGHDT